MSNLQKLQPVEKSTREIRQTILTNIIKMLTERKWIKKENMDKKISEIIKIESDDLVYKIKIDNYKIEDDKIFAVKIIPQKITSVSKASGISDFLNIFKKNRKLIVVSSINKKAKQYIKLNYPRTEIFTEGELMINLIDQVLQPKFEVLTKEEVSEFYEKYNCKKRNLPKMLSDDPVSRYYNLKPDDILRITRSSKSAGFSITYRLIIKGEIK